jgi:hypothetical protein
VSVLPDPVGARISVWSPPAMAGQPRSWASVGAGNEVENHVRTGSLNASREPMREGYEPPVTTPCPGFRTAQAGGASTKSSPSIVAWMVQTNW